MVTKTHYRKVFKSDHLGVADLEDFIESGSDLTFTIKHVRQEIGVRVAGKKGDHNIAYFVENIKPLVLNSGNAKIVKGFAGNSPFVEDWVNIPIQFYVDNNVKFGGSIVSGVRINLKQPKKMSQAELSELEKLLVDTGADRAKFLAFFKIDKLAAMPGNQVNKAKKMLQSKVK